MKNSIKREIVINATQEKIYQAIADPKKVVSWFPDKLTGSYREGEHTIFDFSDCGKSAIYITKADPCSYFAFRWVPGESNFVDDVLSVPNTLVEFHIQAQENGVCKVTLVESGFETLPVELIEKSVKQNTQGWEHMIDRLIKYVEAA
ncbi:SRPBCC domain-containing protein [Thalassotalea sp. 1_MG-2023]|uniref:SRPBCC domain-containing protein n=1 Tax=Thalassotalea sp. 1_MG-2023 TaxID=3062680 RepID=UPI0026E35A5B|nr:SRPBCC domain-containing protein [Thalassotalea sp. 1_MG-2023]MDO6428715.1 SRPBCC domain-containing protein [Thalassotalea sp. 1_MG-2023]